MSDASAHPLTSMGDDTTASLVATFQPGSVHSASVLLEAYQMYLERNARSHELVTGIRPDLVEAVDKCIDAAGREYDIGSQHLLLKAAAFGKTFLELYNPTDFVKTSQMLRMLNAVRQYGVGIAITYDQSGGFVVLRQLQLTESHCQIPHRLAGIPSHAPCSAWALLACSTHK